ncbi:hypothetical protein K437DRAFT_269878, partial [Tilletiaria anomala UBC 951]
QQQQYQQQQHGGVGGNAFPPRPPLRMLIPSIMFTLMLAVGAGLLTVFTNYRIQKREEESRLKNAQRAHAERGREQYAAAAATGPYRTGFDSPPGLASRRRQ